MKSELQSGKRARALGPHSTVGVVSLASCVERSALEAGCRALRALSGWQVESSPLRWMRRWDFAGTPASRAAALMEMWQRDDVDAIVCARGGYGSNYLLPLLDFDALKSAPEAFCRIQRQHFGAAGAGPGRPRVVPRPNGCERLFPQEVPMSVHFAPRSRGEPLDLRFPGGSGVQSLVAGEAHASITGGCLSVVVTSLGTPWEIESEGKILFLEDVNEKPFRIDRMLMHLLLAGKFQRSSRHYFRSHARLLALISGRRNAAANHPAHSWRSWSAHRFRLSLRTRRSRETSPCPLAFRRYCTVR